MNKPTMNKPTMKAILLASLAVLGTQSAFAHITYTNRNFGTFQADGLEAPFTITGQTVSSNFGWADATDTDFGDTHRTRAFRFNLANPGVITLDITGVTGFLPAFSIYTGLAHVSPALADHDATPISQAYLTGLNTGPKEGSLFALGNWAVGNDDELDVDLNVITPATLSYFTYLGHAADGTPANYGAASGINGDGAADNFVTGTFSLPAGDYSVFIGGADYSTQAPGPYTTYGITPTLTVVPEPSSALLLALGIPALLRRRRASRGSHHDA